MANYSHLDYKQYGPNILATATTHLALVKNPVKTDTFAQFQAKIIASIAIDATDVSFAAAGQDLQVTIAAQSGIDPVGTAVLADDLSVAAYSTVTEKVYIVQDAENREITNGTGDTVNIPALVAFIREVTAVP